MEGILLEVRGMHISFLCRVEFNSINIWYTVVIVSQIVLHVTTINRRRQRLVVVVGGWFFILPHMRPLTFNCNTSHLNYSNMPQKNPSVLVSCNRSPTCISLFPREWGRRLRPWHNPDDYSAPYSWVCYNYRWDRCSLGGYRPIASPSGKSRLSVKGMVWQMSQWRTVTLLSLQQLEKWVQGKKAP